MTSFDIPHELPSPAALPPAPLAATVRERYGVDLGALGRVARRLSFAVKTSDGWVRGGDAERTGFARFEREILRDGAPPGWLLVEMEFGGSPGTGVRFLDRDNLVVWRASHEGGVRRWILAYAPLDGPHAAPRAPLVRRAGAPSAPRR